VEERAVMEAPAPPAVEDYGAEQASIGEQMIIRTAHLALKVEETERALAQIKSIATSLGGYVADSNIWRSDEKLQGTVTIRVPAESFDAAMEQITGLALEVERENLSGQDVTEEYTDLGARLRNLEATEKELLELLTEVREKTRKAEDVLAVHRELTSIRGEIEQVKGRMQYLERMTALATITVELIPKEAIVRTGWAPSGTLQDALRGLVRALQSLTDVTIWVVVFILPIALVVLFPFLVIFLIWRHWRRRAVTDNG
jgi:chromosome segregation ATPase